MNIPQPREKLEQARLAFVQIQFVCGVAIKAIESVKHHKQITTRVKDKIKELLDKEASGYWVSMQPQHAGMKIQISGNAITGDRFCSVWANTFDEFIKGFKEFAESAKNGETDVDRTLEALDAGTLKLMLEEFKSFQSRLGAAAPALYALNYMGSPFEKLYKVKALY